MSKKDIKIEEKKKNKNVKKHWFTLVELIVVITILAILWTIAFISLQWYSLNARDWVRISDMKNIAKWLSLQYAKIWVYPKPEKASTITASWLTIRYQWLAWANVLSFAWLWNLSQWGGRDPKSLEYYTYITDWRMSQYNIVGYFETWDSILYNKLIPKVSASYSWWLMKTLGANLWMIYESASSIPIHEKYPEWITIDIKTSPTLYKVRFSIIDEVEWTWNVLYTAFYNRDRYLLNDKDLAKLDDSLVWYWDMESTVTTWSILAIKDFSKNGNLGYCYNWWALINCWSAGWPLIQDWSMSFDWNDHIQVNKNVYTNSMTVLMKIRPTVFDSNWHWIFWYQAPWTWLRPFNFRLTNSSLAWNWWFHYDMQEWSSSSFSNACSTWKRCADNVTYQYNPNSDKVMQFYVAMRRQNGIVNITMNWEPFLVRDCRSSPTNPANITECPNAQYNNFNNFHTNFDTFWIWKVDNFFKWTIDEVRIYNRYLSDSEISNIYSATNNIKSISIQ